MPKERIIGGKVFEDIEVGADPELRFKGFKPRPYIPYEGQFGADGPNSQIGELRPEPCYDPINLVNGIERIMRHGWRDFGKLQKIPWLAGSCPDDQPIGGHIHLNSYYKKNLEFKLEALDKLLAPVSLMLEDRDMARKRRLNSEYGKLSNERRGFKTKEQFEGSQHPLCHDGFEYRALSSWLTSKQIAAGHLCLAKVIGFEAHNESLHKHLYWQLKFINRNKDFNKAFQECDKKFFAPIIPAVYRIVKTFKLFPFYERYINYLFQLIFQNRTWDEHLDLKQRWNIVPAVRQTQKMSEDRKMIMFDFAWENVFNSSLVIPSAPVLSTSDQTVEQAQPSSSHSEIEEENWALI